VTASEAPHLPVLLDQVVEALSPRPGDFMIDATFGAGGYTRALLAAGADVLALDRDPTVQPHADAVTIYPRALSMLRAYPGAGLTVDVAPLRYILDGAVALFAGETGVNLAASQPPVGMARFVGIYLDLATNAIGTVDGATTIDAGPVIPDVPAFPDSVIPTALVRLDGSATVFTEADFVDLRPVLGAASTGGADFARIVCFEGNVITNNDEVMWT
jgi:hypothetical protein